MAARRPLVRVGGRDRQLPAGDRLDLPLATSTEPGLMSAADKAEINSLGSASRANFAAMPFVNLMPDAGRFGGKIDTTSLLLSSSFTASSYFPVYNGAQTNSAGKFIHDNSSYGGGNGALTESLTSLLAAMNRPTDARRYGVEFYVAAYTAGSQTTVPTTGADGVVRYLLLAMQKAIASASAQATFVSWVRAKTGSMHIAIPAYVDGGLREAGYVLAEGWHHVRIVAGSAYGYFSNMPYVYAAPGSTIEFAVPAYFSGIVDVGMHQSPLMAINGVSS